MEEPKNQIDDQVTLIENTLNHNIEKPTNDSKMTKPKVEVDDNLIPIISNAFKNRRNIYNFYYFLFFFLLFFLFIFFNNFF